MANCTKRKGLTYHNVSQDVLAFGCVLDDEIRRKVFFFAYSSSVTATLILSTTNQMLSIS